MQTQPRPRDPALRPFPGPGPVSVPARLARALTRAARRARDAAAEYHRAQHPPLRSTCRAPFSGFPHMNQDVGAGRRERRAITMKEKDDDHHLPAATSRGVARLRRAPYVADIVHRWDVKFWARKQ